MSDSGHQIGEPRDEFDDRLRRVKENIQWLLRETDHQHLWLNGLQEIIEGAQKAIHDLNAIKA